MTNDSRCLYYNGHIIDGTGQAWLGYMMIEGAYITEIGKGSASEALLASSRNVDLNGRTVVPGMIDCHVHLSMDALAKLNPAVTDVDHMIAFMRASRNALHTLHSGVTTVRDCGTPGHVDFALRRASQDGLCITPRLLLSGQALCMTGGHGWQFLGVEVDGPDQARRAAREQLKLGADNIKLIATGGILTPGTAIGNAQLSVEEMRAAVEEAHNAGKIANAHAHGGQGIKNAIKAGVDSVEHAYFVDAEGIDMMLEHGTTIVATSAAVRNVVLHGTQAGIPDNVVDKARSAIESHVSSFKMARKAGVRLAMGTDSGVPFTHHGKNLDELAYFVEMGMTPMEAIQVATRDSARMLKLGDKVGTLEAGKYADFLVIDGDPLEDISILRDQDRIRQVVLNGRTVVDRDASRYLIGAAFSTLEMGGRVGLEH